jgi:hypothetical protein
MHRGLRGGAPLYGGWCRDRHRAARAERDRKARGDGNRDEFGGTQQTILRSCHWTLSKVRRGDVPVNWRVRASSTDGRYWARTSDPQLVELVLSQLS